MSERVPEQLRLRRRDFLQTLAGGAIMLAAADVLAGCGGGSGSGGSTPQRSYLTVQAQVNQTQISGNGNAVLSAFNLTTVGSNGSASVPVSKQGAQAVMISDAAGKIRGAAISTGSSPGAQSTLIFDAASTAAALVFMTPGIMSVDATEAATRLSQIKSLASFVPLSNYLLQNLPAAAIDDLRAQQSLDPLIAACISDWFAQFMSGKAVSGHARDASSQFSAAWGLGPEYPINVTNSAFRFDSVVQQNLAADGTTETVSPTLLQFHNGLASLLTGVLNGPALLSWGALLDSGSVVSAMDSISSGILSDQQAAIVRLWVYGPGLAGSSDAPPDVDALYAKATTWGQSALYYIVFPYIDVILGEAALLGKGIKAAEIVWGSIQKSLNVTAVVNAAKNGFNATFFAALIDLLVTVFGLTLAILAAGDIVIAASLEAIGAAMTAAAVYLGSASLELVTNSWSSAPASSSFDLIVSTAGITVQ